MGPLKPQTPLGGVPNYPRPLSVHRSWLTGTDWRRQRCGNGGTMSLSWTSGLLPGLLLVLTVDTMPLRVRSVLAAGEHPGVRSRDAQIRIFVAWGVELAQDATLSA